MKLNSIKLSQPNLNSLKLLLTFQAPSSSSSQQTSVASDQNTETADQRQDNARRRKKVADRESETIKQQEEIAENNRRFVGQDADSSTK